MINNLCVIVPTRGRPHNIRRLMEAWRLTDATADLMVCVDLDDPEIEEYKRVVADPSLCTAQITLHSGPRLRLGPTLNHYAGGAAKHWRYLGFMGDDHVPVTALWDQEMTKQLDRLGTGIAYGNDLFQGENLPTAVFLTSDIVRTLGYMCPPNLVHMYLDNTWKAWGQALGRLRYCPEIIIEHLHPQAGGKAAEDEGYHEVWPYMETDWPVWEEYRTSPTGLAADVAKLKGLVDGTAE